MKNSKRAQIEGEKPLNWILWAVFTLMAFLALGFLAAKILGYL